MRIAHFGTFDVENYGDLLFPLVLERRLAHLGAEIVHVSPVGGAAVLPDARPSLASKEAFESQFDAVMVGGGNILHARETSLPAYGKSPERARLAYAELWLGASELAARLEVPLVWNAPGVPAAFGPATAPFVAWAAASCDRLAVRDSGSAHRLRSAGFAGPVAIVPDTALDVASLWPAEQRRAAFRDAFAARKVDAIPERTVFIHLNSRYATGEAGEIAERVARIARRFDALPILAALGGCHGDGELARRVGRAMPGPVLVLDELRSLCEAAACIEASVAYVGSSLHGLITACAFGRPAILVARESSRGSAKFSGFIAQWTGARCSGAQPGLHWVSSWEDVEGRIGDDGGLVAPARVDRDSVEAQLFGTSPRDRLETHWRAVEEAIVRPRSECRARRSGSRRVLDFLRARGTVGQPLFDAVLSDQARARR